MISLNKLRSWHRHHHQYLIRRMYSRNVSTNFTTTVLPQKEKCLFFCSKIRLQQQDVFLLVNSRCVMTCYLPYQQETIETIKTYDNLVNLIYSLAGKDDDKTNLNSYNQYVKKQTNFIPLVPQIKRDDLIKDWNEIISIIREMGVVPEEADQVSLLYHNVKRS